jgi:hypothetical protein
MKPAVSQVKEWIENEFIGNSVAKVYFASASSCLDDDFYKVVGGGKTKYFYGETAWQDAQRLAGDIYFQVQFA